MPDILTTGEMLIDFTPVKEVKGALFPNPGGAPGNVAVQLARLGVSAGFIGKVGNDKFGRLLRCALYDNGVDVRNLVDDPQRPTTLAFVHLDDSGDRSFTFYRDPGADTQLRPEEIDMNLVKECKLLHFGSLSLTTEPGRSTTLDLVKKARDMGKIISYDPNWRPVLWPSEEAGVAGMAEGLPLCHLLKISEEELCLLTGTESISAGVKKLHDMGIILIMVTLGPDGCVSSYKSELRHHATFDTPVVDTTGSGDSFWGAFLSQLIQNGYDTPEGLENLDAEKLGDFCRFANAAGSTCATKPGGIPAIGDREAILECMEKYPQLERGFKIN